MKIKTNELSGAALDWAVVKCKGVMDDLIGFTLEQGYTPSTDWAKGGQIIEREQIAIYLSDHKEWTGTDGWKRGTGPTPLIAAMRCYVASKLGDEVEVPDELLEGESK